MNTKKIIFFMGVLLAIALPFRFNSLYADKNDESNEPVNSNNIESIEEDASLSEEDKKIFKLKGQFKSLFTYQETDNYSKYYFTQDPERKKSLIANLNRIRLSPELTLSDYLYFHLDYDNEIIFSNYLKSIEFDQYWRPSEHNDLFDLSKELHSDEDYHYRTKIHRAFLKLFIKDLTLVLGRQQIRFGSGKLWNPLDILNPVSPTFVEGAEEQKGTDALRLEYYLNDTTEIALVLEQKRINDNDDFSKLNSQNTNIVSRIKTTIVKTDIALLGGRVCRRNIGGADISSIIFDGMLRGSAVYSKPDEGKSFIQAGGGYEYNFARGLYLLGEYFFNQHGLNFNRELREAYESSILSGINEDNYYVLSNRFITYNKHYAGLALGYDITPLIRGEFFTIYDFQGKGVFINPSVKYNILENLDFMIGVMKGFISGGASYQSDFDYLEKYGFLFSSLSWYF